MASEYVDFLPLFQETEATVRARLDADVNAGIPTSDERYVDTRPGSFYYDITQAALIEMGRLWDALASEVPAAAFPAVAWGDYLDLHAEAFALSRKAGVKATGTVILVGTPATVVASGITVGTNPRTPDEIPPSFVTTVGGTLSSILPTPVLAVATPTTTGGTLTTGTYYYVVTAHNGVGETVASNEMSAAVTGPTGKVTLDWADVVGATSYRIYRSTTPGTGYLNYYTSTASAYVDTNAAPVAGSGPPAVDGSAGKLRVAIEAADVGVAYNVGVGAITLLLSPAAGVSSVSNDAAASGGTEPEDDASLRQRILNGFQGAGAGTAADYQRWALSRPGVGKVFVTPIYAGPGTVQVVVMTSTGAPVASTVIADVQSYLDPTPGQGAGRAPIGATVTVQTPTAVAVSVVAVLTLRSGYTLDGTGGTIAVRQAVTDALNVYFRALNVGETVVYEHVKAQLFQATGVFSISGVTINGGTADVGATSSPPQVATLGTVSLT